MSRAIFGVISFQLSEISDVNFRKMVSRASSSGTGSSEVAATLLDTLAELKCQPSVKNRFDNIIEHLEKKYTNPVIVSSGAMDSDAPSEDDDEEEEDEPLGELGTEGTNKKRKRNNKRDTYDMEDSFIDDTEAFQEVESAVRSQKAKTLHNGFFVNSGTLEITTETTHEGLPDMPGDKPRYGRLSKRPELLEAFVKFAEIVQTANVKMNKQRFPVQLREAVMALDAIATQCKLHQESEYYQRIAESLGGLVPVAKIKTYLSLARKQAMAQRLLDELNQQITEFCDVMVVRIQRVETPSVEEEASKLGVVAEGEGEHCRRLGMLFVSLTELGLCVGLPGEVKSTVPKPVYLWKLPWDMKSRGLLVAIESTALSWVNHENIFRAAVTPGLQRDLEIPDVASLKDKDELTNVFKRIAGILSPRRICRSLSRSALQECSRVTVRMLMCLRCAR